MKGENDMKRKLVLFMQFVVLMFICSSCFVHRPDELDLLNLHAPYKSGMFHGYSCDFTWSIDVPTTKKVFFHYSGPRIDGIQYTYSDSSFIYVTTQVRSENYSHIVSSINAVDSLRRFRPIFLQAFLPYKDTLDFRGVDNDGIAWREKTIRIYSSYLSVGYVNRNSANTNLFDTYIESLKMDYTVPLQEDIDNEIRGVKERNGNSVFIKMIEDLQRY